MSQAKTKTNFKTYDAIIRLLAAVMATANPKLDYVELARHVGGGASKDAIQHRFRPIKQLAKMQAAYVERGEDPGELPADKGALAELVGGGITGVAVEHRLRHIKQLGKLQIAYRNDPEKDPGELPVEKGEIQKLFGESTAGGIEWQFHKIKNLGKAQQEAVKNGVNPATLTAASTPSAGRGRGTAASTPGSRATPRTPGTAGTGTRGRKRKVTAALPPVDSSDGENGDANDPDFSIVETPTKRPTKRAKAVATPASAKRRNESLTATGIPAAASTPVTNKSIFGGDTAAPAVMQSAETFVVHGAQHPASSARSAAGLSAIKREFSNGANPFLIPVSADDYSENYSFDINDGVI